MAQQRISFSIATHPPVHPPVASPPEPAAKSGAVKGRNGKGSNGHSANGHGAKPASTPSLKHPNGAGHEAAPKLSRRAARKAAKAEAADAQSGQAPDARSAEGPDAKAKTSAKTSVRAKFARAKNGKPKFGKAQTDKNKAGENKTGKAKTDKTGPADAKPGTAPAKVRKYPAATQALLPARAKPPLLPPPRRGILAGVGHTTGAAAGLAAAFAAVILGVAWLLQTTFDPDGDLTPDAASLVARIAPAAGRPKMTQTQLRVLSERLADVEHSTYRKRYTRTVRVGRGDRLLQLLILEGIARQDAFDAIQVLSKVFDLRKIQAGQRVELVNGIVNNVPQSFVGLRFELGNGAREISVMREGTGPFTATDVKKQLRPELVRGTGQIQTSLYVAGLKAGVPPAVMIQLIQIYSFDVDFQREIRKGDAFRVLFRNYYDEDGKLVRQGDILYAALTLRGQELELFRFTPRNGHIDYFNAQGHSVRKALMRTPIDGARLTSRFGRRRHPILGYTRAHVGVDFAAPPGTPIYAAGDGMIVTRVRTGGYGNYIKIRHNASYHTAYAHMSRFAVGMAAGTRVRQGQVIGYVGSTGLASGPHLHYEVHYKGRPINPLRIKLATGQKLTGLDLREFLVRRTLISNMYLSRAKDVRLASAPRRRTTTGPSN